MRATENERRDWAIIAFILLFGLFWILVAGGWALRFTPSWELNTDVESRLDPNSDFLTNKPSGLIEPVDPAILSDPEWMNRALTPGASHSSSTPLATATRLSTFTSTPGTVTATQTSSFTVTAFTTNTTTALASATNTLIYAPPIATSTSKTNPASASTPTPTAASTGSITPTSTATSTSISVSTSTSTPTATSTSSGTATSTPTSTASATPSQTATFTATATNTPDPVEPDFGGPDGNAMLLGNGAWVEFNLSGFVLDGNSAWDLVYYEKEETSAAGKIHLGLVLIEAYDQTTGAWYTIYNWGDGAADTNASYNNVTEPDGFPVNKSLLYGVSPLNTGIAIDIDAVAIGQGGSAGDSITKIRITSLSSNDCEIDALQMLR